MWIKYKGGKYGEEEETNGFITEIAKVKGGEPDTVIITFEDGDTDIIKATDILRIKAEY